MSRRNKLLVIVIGIVLLFGRFMFLPVYAISGDQEKNVEVKHMSQWDDGLDLTMDITGQGKDKKIVVNADTIGNDTGFYSAYIYQNASRVINNYDGIAFSIQNLSNMPLKMNFNFTINKNTSLDLKDSAQIILESADGTQGELSSITYGTFQIPEKFEGVVYIPFFELTNKDKKQISINRINSWGITLVMEEEQQAAFEISNIRFLGGSVDKVKSSYYLINVLGSSEVVLSDAGTIMKEYRAEVKNLDGELVNKNVIFSIATPVEGANISSDGILEIDGNCSAKEIDILARTEDSINTQKLTIQLLSNKNGGNQGVSTGVAMIPESNQIPSILSTKDRLLINNIKIIKIVTISVSIFISVIVIFWLNKAGKEYKNILKALNGSEDNQDQQEQEEP